MNEELFPTCPIRNILSRFSDKWSLLILYTLNLQPTMRFNAMRREIPDISQKMLTNTLRTLEEDGLVTRTIYAEVPPRVEYSITRPDTFFASTCQCSYWLGKREYAGDTQRSRISRQTKEISHPTRHERL